MDENHDDPRKHAEPPLLPPDLHRFFERTPIPLAVYRQDGTGFKAHIVSEGMGRMYEMEPEALRAVLCGKDPLRHVPEEEHAELWETIRAFSQRDVPFNVVYHLATETTRRLITVHGTGSHEFADDGRRYSTYTDELCGAMRELVKEADIITPNITECCILTGSDYHGEALHDAEALALAHALEQIGCRQSVITGIIQENTIGNLTYINGTPQFSSVHRTECFFSGTGDLFASVLCGSLARGNPLPEAVREAGVFLSQVTQYTIQQNTPASEGVLFEPLLYQLGESQCQ